MTVVVVVVAGIGVWSSRRAARYYIYSPGSAPQVTTSPDCKYNQGTGDLRLSGSPCVRIVVPADRAHTIDGRLLMVDVLVGKPSPFQWLAEKLGLLHTFDRGAQLLPNAAVLGTTPASQLGCQDAQEMATAQQTAPIVALAHLGYKVGMTNLGALVQEVIPGSAADKAGIDCNDLIVAVNGTKVTTADQIAPLIEDHRPGSTIAVTVKRAGTSGHTVEKTLHATLGAKPGDASAGFLGIATFTDTTYDLPFPVSIEVGSIGGPSAGLALTLGLLDVLSNGRLTGGHVVAATGTIAPNGAVGDVGGVAQKTVAVERAGAQLFLVPPQEYAAAESEANGKMKIEKVSSLSQALQELAAIGGQVPKAASSS